MWFFMYWVTTFQGQKRCWQMLTSTVHIVLFMLEMGMLQYLVRIMWIFRIISRTRILSSTTFFIVQSFFLNFNFRCRSCTFKSLKSFNIKLWYFFNVGCLACNQRKSWSNHAKRLRSNGRWTKNLYDKYS